MINVIREHSYPEENIISTSEGVEKNTHIVRRGYANDEQK